MKIDNREYFDFEDVMIRPQLSIKKLNSRNDVDIRRTFRVNFDANRPYEWTGVPIIAANMDTVGTFAMAEVLTYLDCCVAIHKHYELSDLLDFFIRYRELEEDHLLFYTLGINDNCINKFEEFTKQFGSPKNICIDVANGYANRFIDTVSRIRDEHPDSIIMAGNVVTGDVTYALLQAGASIGKAGIGSGSACLTRRVTGVGMPQLSAILECANVAHGMNGLICSDGGCVYPGDVSKALGGGADFVMLGGMLSGHDECNGKYVTKDGSVWDNKESITDAGYTEEDIQGMMFYGMSSDTAMNNHNGGIAEYKASEGRTLIVPYKGSVGKTISEILGGIRSTMTYVGAEELRELSKCTQFIPHSRQLNTSLVNHDIKE